MWFALATLGVLLLICTLVGVAVCRANATHHDDAYDA